MVLFMVHLSLHLMILTVKGNWEGKYVGYRSYIGEENVDLSAFGLPNGLYHVWTLPLKLEGHGKGGKIDKYQMFHDFNSYNIWS